MKIWYKAVCDEHKTMCNIFVDNPSRTSLYLSSDDNKIQDWLMDHHICKLRLIHDDFDLDECFDKKYGDISWEKIK